MLRYCNELEPIKPVGCQGQEVKTEKVSLASNLMSLVFGKLKKYSAVNERWLAKTWTSERFEIEATVMISTHFFSIIPFFIVDFSFEKELVLGWLFLKVSIDFDPFI